MASKQKTITSIISLKKPAKDELAKILSEPQTPEQIASVKKSTGVYTYYVEKWKKLSNK